MNLHLSSRRHVPALRNSFQALAPQGGRTLAMQSATESGSMLLAEHVRPSQESPEDSAAGKKARTGPSPASEDEVDDPGLTASLLHLLRLCSEVLACRDRPYHPNYCQNFESRL